MASLSTRRSQFDKLVMPNGLQAIPNASPQTLARTDCLFFQLTVCNTTAADIALSVTDGQGSPIKLVPDTPIAAKSLICFNCEDGTLLKSGIIWQAASAGLNGEIVAFAKQSAS